MASKRSFYKTVIRVEVLTEDVRPDFTSLAEVHYSITDGGDCGTFKVKRSDLISGPEAAQALRDMESEPAFFGLDADGNDLDDEL